MGQSSITLFDRTELVREIVKPKSILALEMLITKSILQTLYNAK